MSAMQGLGEKIKSLRQRRGLTIAETASKTGIDKGTLSRIENGKMKGTLDSHAKIAEALGVRLPDLYEDVLAQSETAGNPANRLETFSHSSGAIAQLLTSGTLGKKMMPVLLKLKPGSRTEPEEYPPLTERFIYVMQGSLKATAGRDSTLLKKGESMYFNASRPHHFESTSKFETHVLSVITPVSL